MCHIFDNVQQWMAGRIEGKGQFCLMSQEIRITVSPPNNETQKR